MLFLHVQNLGLGHTMDIQACFYRMLSIIPVLFLYNIMLILMLQLKSLNAVWSTSYFMIFSIACGVTCLSKYSIASFWSLVRGAQVILLTSTMHSSISATFSVLHIGLVSHCVSPRKLNCSAWYLALWGQTCFRRRLQYASYMFMSRSLFMFVLPWIFSIITAIDFSISLDVFLNGLRHWWWYCKLWAFQSWILRAPCLFRHQRWWELYNVWNGDRMEM